MALATLFTSTSTVSLSPFALRSSQEAYGLSRQSIRSPRLCRPELWSLRLSFESKRRCHQDLPVCKAANSSTETMAASTETPMPNIFDGTTRLYLSPFCPYAQRVAIATNYKELDDVERVHINLSSKPEWYVAKVYPPGKVPALEHAGKVIGESMDLLTYLDDNFSGPKLLPEDDEKKAFAKELYGFSDELVKTGFMVLSSDDLSAEEIETQLGPRLQRLESALTKYGEGPFFLGKFSAVDCAYVPFLERFSIAFMDVHKSQFDITQGRPALAKWFQAMEGVKAYTDARVPREQTVELYRKMLASGYFKKIFSSSRAN